MNEKQPCPLDQVPKDPADRSQYLMDRVMCLLPSPEVMLERTMKNRAEKEARFASELMLFIEEVVGTRYRLEHQGNFLPNWEAIQGHIIQLFETGKGSYYSGDPGTGKSHILVEYIFQLCWREWEEYLLLHDYPDARKFIEATVHYMYSGKLGEALRLGEKIPIAKYNLIDDFGVEAVSTIIMAKLDQYYEDINGKGKSLVVSTNIKREDLAKSPFFRRVYSRLLMLVHFYVLPPIDYRDPKNRGRFD
jgi:hypothetical protein